jgi:hypothetical protein
MGNEQTLPPRFAKNARPLLLAALVVLAFQSSCHGFVVPSSSQRPSSQLLLSPTPPDEAGVSKAAAVLLALWVGVTTPFLPSFAATTTPTPPPLPALEIRIDEPKLLDLVKTADMRQRTIDRVSFLAQSIESFFGPAVSVQLPDLHTKATYTALAKQLINGGTTISVNDEPITFQIIGSKPGAIQIQISNPLIPGLPIPGLPTTPALITAGANAVASSDTVSSVLEEVVETIEDGPIWQRPLFRGQLRLDVGDIHKALTPIDVLGGGSLALGAVYATSYGFYTFSNWKDAQDAANKKKKAAAAAQAKKQKPVQKPMADDKVVEEASEAAVVVAAAAPGSDTKKSFLSNLMGAGKK